MRWCFVVFLLLSVSLFPQTKKSEMSEMRIIGMAEYHPEELIDYDVKDANGDVAAGLIIETDLVGLAYDANLGMVKMNHSPGRDFLFLQYKERELKIMLSGYAPLQVILKKYGITLEKGKSWLLKLTADKKSELISTVISTAPPGATIFIDGENKGQIRTTTLKDGEHDLRIELEGYSPITTKINVTLNNALFEYKLEQREPAAVNINSTPVGAKIFIDNIDKGLTNKTLFLFPGEYDLRLSSTGYLDASRKISVAENKDNTFNITLAKNVGTLVLELNPKTASVEINKEVQSRTDEIILAPGKYQLTVSKQGYYPITETIEIKLNERTAKAVTLKEVTGSLQLSISPSDAEVELVKGTTRNNWKGAKYLKGIAVGKYSITAKKAGYKEYSATVKIEESKTAVVDINLDALAEDAAGEIDANTTGEQLARKQRPELFKPKDEFESQGEYNSRVNEAENLSAKIESEISIERNKKKQAKILASRKAVNDLFITSLGSYNAEEESFPITISGKEGKIKVPKSSARSFKENYITAQVKAYRQLNNSLKKEVMSAIEVIDPNSGAAYKFDDGSPQMIYVEGGTFKRDGVTITISSFSIGNYEVTQKQWEEVMGENPSNFKGANRPVEQVSWNSIQKFIEKLNIKTGETYRLPTEAEWEYAARGGNKSRGYEYSGSNSVGEVAWYDLNSNSQTHEVGQKQPNELGIYDMSGNVREWCSDWYSDSYDNSKTLNPKGPSSGSYRVLRGGSWFILDNYCRSSIRNGNLPDDWNYDNGFRLVQE